MTTEKMGRRMVEAFARRTKERAEQQEIQAAKDKLQKQLLTMADLKAQIDVFKNADNAITNASAQQSSDEQYRMTIIEKMINHIRQKDKTND